MDVQWEKWKEYLLPKLESADPAFRHEIGRLSVIGLRAIILISVGTPLVMFPLTDFFRRLGYAKQDWLWTDLFIMLPALLSIPVAFSRRLQQYARLMGCVIGFCVTAAFVTTAIAWPDQVPGIAQLVPANIVLVMLVGIGSLPMTPLQTLGLGVSILINYFGSILLYPDLLFVPNVTPVSMVSLCMVTLICAGLASVIYHQRVSTFRARQQLLQAQAGPALSESSAAQGRLAATVSHEFNSPIGTIASTLHTLSLILDKDASQRTPATAESLREVLAAASRSCQRLTQIVHRMQRFTNLDRAEEVAVDVNRLIEDTVDLFRSDIQKKADVFLQLKPVPLFRCRPQQITAVVSNLLLNSLEAMDGKGVIRIRSSQLEEKIHIEIEDNGRGIEPDRLLRIFEPSFEVVAGRVASGNWGLFNCRNIVTSHGGNIAIDSTPGLGTTVRLALPTSLHAPG